MIPGTFYPDKNNAQRRKRLQSAADPDTAGDIFYLEILGRKIVIVNNYDMANELMDKRSANYSDRPVFPLFMK